MQTEYTVLSPQTTTIEEGVVIGKNVVIYANNHLLKGTVIEENCILYPNNTLQNAKIGKNCTLQNSIVTDSCIGANCKIGAFSHVHTNSTIGENCRIGNFVEVKKSKLANGVKVAHLSYVGDAEVYENCNVGCGVIFCNYDGRKKEKIVVEKDCFIGSNVNLIAPLHIAAGCYICAGTTVSKNTTECSCIIGRVRAESVAKLASKYCKNR